MAEIGTLGEVVFTVSYDLVRTFQDYKRNSSARLQAHEIIGKKPVTEFLGPGLDSISFAIDLSAFKGVSPKEEAEKLRKIMQNGEYVNLVIAGSPVSNNKWVIESINESVSARDGKGNIIRAKVDITIHEYIENVYGGE